VVRVNASEWGSSVDSVEFADAAGRQWTLPAATIIVCAGGIENARLLLCSDNVTAEGLGNAHDLVGRYLMDHLRGTVARYSVKQGRAVLKHFGTLKALTAQANLYHFGMRLSPAVQRSEGLLHSALWVSSESAPDDPWEALSRLLRGNARIRQDCYAILRNSGLLLYGLNERLIHHRGLPRKLDAVYVEAMCEQLPNRDSRITLSGRRDRLGMRMARVDWRVGEEEARALRRVTQLMVEQFSRMGLEPPVLEDWVREEAMPPQTFRDVAHPTGTTRMADDPARGVVDAECQVHGVRGLYVAGSSVFPTAGHANPTQTIVALAVRLADTLKARAAPVTLHQ
jgi:choline dehydrogenase-like flavoprotein